MTIDNGSTNDSLKPDHQVITEGFFPATNEIASNELLPNVMTKKNHFNSKESGTNSVINEDRPLRPDQPLRVDVTSVPQAQSTVNTLGLIEGPSIPMEFNASKKIAARSLDLSIDENSGFDKTAWIMENGEPRCNHCDSNFLPSVVGAKMACTNCGCGRPNDDHGLLEDDFDGMDLVMGMAGCGSPDTAAEIEPVPGNEGTGMSGNDMIKEMSRLKTTEDYLEVFKTANNSELYTRGYMDAMDGKPLQVELAEVSDDYFHGYEQYSFYHSKPQENAPQNLYDIKPNSNQVPRLNEVTNISHETTGPMELTENREHSVASRLPFPTDVINKFFEV